MQYHIKHVAATAVAISVIAISFIRGGLGNFIVFFYVIVRKMDQLV